MVPHATAGGGRGQGHARRTGASAGGVAALGHEVLDDAVKDGVVVVLLQAELHEVAHRLRRLFGPELNVDVAQRGCDDHLRHGPMNQSGRAALLLQLL